MPLASAVSRAPLSNWSHVAKAHRRTHHNSHSYIVTTADDALYALKIFPSHLAKEQAFCEAYTSILGSRLGISMAHWEVLQVDDQSNQSSLLSDRVAQISGCEIAGGVYFGSRMLDGVGTVRSYLSAISIKAYPEIARQLGWITLFDVWIGHFGLREYAALIEKGSSPHIYFYGHSGAFRPEPEPNFEERAVSRYADACKIAGNTKYIHHFLALLARVDNAALMQAAQVVPAIWRDAALEARVIAMLQWRRDALIAALRDGITTFYKELPAGLLCDTAQSKLSRPPASPA